MIDVQDIGIDEMVSPPRSDLTSPDFFLWSYIKNIVYKKIIPTPEDLKHRIRAAYRNIPIEAMRNYKLTKLIKFFIDSFN